MTRRAPAFLMILAALSTAAAACAPGGTGQPSEPSRVVNAGPKVLRIGMYEGEPQTGIALFGGSLVFSRGGIGAPEHAFTFHAGLTTYNERGEVIPWIAAKVPSLEDGDWVVFPDGRMEMTWNLRQNVRWHDGTPATAVDFVFGSQVTQDRELPLRRGEPAGLITDVSAPDPYTLLVRWKGLYPEANSSGPTDVPAVPSHLMEDLYRSGDKQAFINSRYWTSEFVGVGAYRLGEWEPGAHLEALAFDDYFLGRPRIDRLVFTYFSDASALYLAHLAGDVDMTPFGSFQSAHFIPFKTEWEPTGAGRAIAVFAGSRNYRFQFGYPDAPWMDRRVRRALIHMLDRQSIADSLLAGLSNVADTTVGPGDPIYRLLEQRGFPKYPYNPSEAQRLMTEAGWTRSGDGMYRSAAGQPIDLEVRVGNPPLVREGSAIAALFKAGGVETSVAVGSDGEIRFTFPGLEGAPLRDTLQDLAGFVTNQAGTAANRWMGNNRGRYSNPVFDGLYSRALVTLNGDERQGLMADLLKMEAEETASIHLFYDMAQQTIILRKGVQGPGPVSSKQLVVAWNIHTWDIE